MVLAVVWKFSILGRDQETRKKKPRSMVCSLFFFFFLDCENKKKTGNHAPVFFFCFLGSGPKSKICRTLLEPLHTQGFLRENGKSEKMTGSTKKSSLCKAKSLRSWPKNSRCSFLTLQACRRSYTVRGGTTQDMGQQSNQPGGQKHQPQRNCHICTVCLSYCPRPQRWPSTPPAASA